MKLGSRGTLKSSRASTPRFQPSVPDDDDDDDDDDFLVIG